MQGTDFGRYRLLELLGRGGMGEVWRARDTATDRTVAVKVLLPHFATDDVFQERFRREAHAAAGLNEPHVVPIHDYGEIEGRLYVDMRLIEGSDLQTILRNGPLDPDRAVHIVEQIAMAVEAAHEVGLVHRDIKPSNILIARFDFAYLIDFGIAHVTGQGRLTNTGSTLGTWHYMAPERFTTGHADTSADIYALTCVLHECLTGAQPFPGDSAEQQIAAHLMTPPPRPSLSARGVPAALDAVVAKGMAKEPKDRYRSAMHLAQAARASIAQRPTTPTAPAYQQEAAPYKYVEYPAAASTQLAQTHPAPTLNAAVPPPISDHPPGSGSPAHKSRNWIPVISAAGIFVAIVAVVAVVLAVSHFNRVSRTAGTTTSSITSAETTSATPSWGRTSTKPPAAPQEENNSSPNETIATYIAKNGITETAVSRGDPGAPTVELPVPANWRPAGADTPEWAYGAIVYTGPEAAEYTPSIVAIVSKLTGNVDEQTILDLAPGELNNLPGWKAMNEGEPSTLGEYPAYQLGGTWVQDGQTKIVAQKTVVIPGSDGLYILQLNADGLEDQAEIVGSATDVIDSQTTITP
jgi:serine/threonine protein kinase